MNAMTETSNQQNQIQVLHLTDQDKLRWEVHITPESVEFISVDGAPYKRSFSEFCSKEKGPLGTVKYSVDALLTTLLRSKFELQLDLDKRRKFVLNKEQYLKIACFDPLFRRAMLARIQSFVYTFDLFLLGVLYFITSLRIIESQFILYVILRYSFRTYCNNYLYIIAIITEFILIYIIYYLYGLNDWYQYGLIAIIANNIISMLSNISVILSENSQMSKPKELK